MVADLQAGGSGVKPVKKSSIKEKVSQNMLMMEMIKENVTVMILYKGRPSLAL